MNFPSSQADSGKGSNMSINTLKIIVAFFFIVHGLVHISLSWVPTPQPGALRTPYFPAWWKGDVDSKWPVSNLGLPTGVVRTAGWILWVIVMATYVLSGLGLLGVPGLNSIWIPSAVLASIVSIILIVLYWHPWLPFGILLDVVILAAVYFHIPARLFVK